MISSGDAGLQSGLELFKDQPSQEKILLHFIFYPHQLYRRKALEITTKRAYVVASSVAFHISMQVPAPPLKTFVDRIIVAAGLGNSSRRVGKANSPVLRFLFQSFKGQFVDQRGVERNKDPGDLKYSRGWNVLQWGSAPRTAPTSRCCSGNKNKKGKWWGMNKTLKVRESMRKKGVIALPAPDPRAVHLFLLCHPKQSPGL